MQRHALRARGRAPRALLGALVALLALATSATAAFADGNVSTVGSQYVFQAAAGDDNALTVSQTDTSVQFYDDLTAVTADQSALDAGCTQTDANTVDCNTVDQGISGITANLDDIDDELYTSSSATTTLPLTVDGGAGDDNLNGDQGPDTIHGGAGNDNIYGDPNGADGAADRLYGDDGDDDVRGVGGDDIIDTGAGNDRGVGGPGNDTIDTGSGDDSNVLGGPGDDSISTGDGNDSYVFGDCDGGCGAGSHGNDTIDTGAGDDWIVNGEGGNDTILAGAGNDSSLDGGNGDDTVDGGTGDDDISSGGFCGPFCVTITITVDDGNDHFIGGPGNDTIDENSGADTVDGGSGDDYLNSWSDGAPDSVKGGDGVDSFYYYACCDSDDQINITLDDQADDGSKLYDGGNNVASDIENVEVGGSNAKVNLVGSPSANALEGDNADDTITGGLGPDYLFGQGGNDTMNAQDGFPDGIECGPGDADVANVDQFDTVAHCETVNRTTLGSAYEDAPPKVAWVKPTDGSRTRAGTETPLEVTATDDTGIARVTFLAGTRIACVDTTAPYTCAYRPVGGDVGRTTLTAVANDTLGQSATAVRGVVVGRFVATRLTAKTTPAKDTTDPHRFTTTGRLRLPVGVSTRQGCDGVVAVSVKAGKKTISTRRVALRDDCTYRSRVTFGIPARLNPRTLSVRARFAGNGVLLPKRATLQKVRVAG